MKLQTAAPLLKRVRVAAVKHEIPSRDSACFVCSEFLGEVNVNSGPHSHIGDDGNVP